MATIIVAIEIPDNLQQLHEAFPSLANDSMADVAREAVKQYTDRLQRMYNVLLATQKKKEENA